MNLCLKVDLDRIIGGHNGRILGQFDIIGNIWMLVKFFHWFQVFSTSVEKDIGKILTDAQSAKKKKTSLVIKH